MIRCGFADARDYRTPDSQNQILYILLIHEPFAKFGVTRSLFKSRVFSPESVNDQVTLNPFAV